MKDWRLNERHYGGLTGLDKAQCVKEYGKEQVRKCGAFKTTKSATFFQKYKVRISASHKPPPVC